MGTLLGDSDWVGQSTFDDDYISEESAFLDPLDDDYIREGYEPYEDL